MRIRYANNGIVITAPTTDELYTQVIASPLPEISVPGSTVAATTQDQVTTTHASATYFNNYGISRAVSSDEFRVADRSGLVNLNPEIASLSGGLLTRITDGTATIKTSTPLGDFGVTCDMKSYSAGSVVTRDWAAGSLAEHVTDAVLSRISGDVETERPVFTTANGTTFVRNTGCWASDLNLTAISPWNAASGPYRAGVAITLKHVMYARHYPLYVGDVLTFVGEGNEIVTRTVAAVAALSGDWVNNDIGIASLSSNLPAEITPVKVPPASLLTKLPNLNPRLLAFGTNAIGELSSIRGCLQMNSETIVFSSVLENVEVRPYYYDYISGDSGSPVFMIVNNQLMLLCVITSGFNGQGSAVWQKITQINALIDAMDAGYSLSTMDLTSFPSY